MHGVFRTLQTRDTRNSKSYLSFLSSYKTVYTEKSKALQELADRMCLGLDKLLEAQASVELLQKELNVKEKELREVTMSAQAAEKVKAEVQVVKDKAQSLMDVIEADKSVAMGKLSAAKPALEEAERALQTIQPGLISTVRRLAKPPHLIMRIMDGVILLFQRKIDTVQLDPGKPSIKPSWEEALKLMNGGTKSRKKVQRDLKSKLDKQRSKKHTTPLVCKQVLSHDNKEESCQQQTIPVQSKQTDLTLNPQIEPSQNDSRTKSKLELSPECSDK